jgi:hypothetical protein
MKHTIVKTLIITMISFFAIGSANAATYDFADYIDNGGLGEKGFANTTPFSWTQDNLTLTATAFDRNDLSSPYEASSVYMDKGKAGMGVCHSGLTSNAQCKSPSDDNVTTDEVLTWNFDKSISSLELTLKDTGHRAFVSSIFYSTDSGTNWTTLSSDYSLAFATTIDEISFKTIGSASNEQFYINAATVSAVPEPSVYALMLAGLGLVGFVASRRKQS